MLLRMHHLFSQNLCVHQLLALALQFPEVVLVRYSVMALLPQHLEEALLPEQFLVLLEVILLLAKPVALQQQLELVPQKQVTEEHKRFRLL